MLVCISAPAIDRRLRLKNIAVGQINRADRGTQVEGSVRRVVACESARHVAVEAQ